MAVIHAVILDSMAFSSVHLKTAWDVRYDPPFLWQHELRLYHGWLQAATFSCSTSVGSKPPAMNNTRAVGHAPPSTVHAVRDA